MPPESLALALQMLRGARASRAHAHTRIHWSVNTPLAYTRVPIGKLHADPASVAAGWPALSKAEIKEARGDDSDLEMRTSR